MHSPFSMSHPGTKAGTAVRPREVSAEAPALRGNGWTGLQADGWHRLAGDCQGELSTGSISVTTLKADTPLPPTCYPTKLQLPCGCPELWETLCGGKQAECAEELSTGYVLLNQLREQALGRPWDAVLNCVTPHQREHNSLCRRQGQHTILRDHR